ncbi:lytic transglycosylase domain-containing protein [Ciceribacter azotifigens]|uniref:lytic transglycosylase domain-containing protein n=1 Tax=Ciceribacter azotifigens TaxID=2069303 RepID=UPI003A85841E
MPIAFLDLAQNCAPTVAADTLAGVVSLESGFDPFAIRITDPAPLSRKPSSNSEAIEIATSLAAERQDIQLGLGGISTEQLRKLNLRISEAFDPCRNIQATATLLDEYYRLAVKAGADSDQADQLMLQSYYGRGNPSVGSLVHYDDQVEEEVNRLGRALATVMIGDGGQGGGNTEESPVEVAVETATTDRRADETASAPSWDVFSLRRRSSVLVFQNSQMEQSE